MKALTLWQPWATLIAIGAKRIETRSWSTAYRGPLAIHAAASAKGLEACSHEPFRSTLEWFGFQAPFHLPHMAIVATCNLIDILPVEDIRDVIESRELAFGNYGNGRFAWLLEDVRQLNPIIPTKGAQGIWNWTTEADKEKQLALW